MASTQVKTAADEAQASEEQRPVVLITGATGGIGSATAKKFVDLGWRVALIARSREKVETLVNELGESTALAEVVDVRNSEELDGAIQRIIERAKRLDFVMANAGVLEQATVEETTVESWQRLIETNLTSAFVTARSSLGALRASKGGILFVSSRSGRRGLPGLAAYSASKAALITFSESLGAEVEADGVHSHVLILGPTETTMMASFGDEYRHLLSPSDVADTIAWLASRPRGVLISEILLAPLKEG